MKPPGQIWLHFASLIFSLHGVVATIDCSDSESFTVNSQEDVAALINCGAVSQGSINGNITIGPKASGTIEFRNLGIVNGNITAQSNPSLASLSFVSDDPDAVIDGLFNRIELRNLSSLSSFSYPQLLRTPGTLVFENLPSLEVIDFSILSWLGDVQLQNLPKLQTLLLNTDWFGVSGNIDVNDIGIETIDPLFNIGIAAKNIKVNGIPNIKTLAFALAEARDVSISGGGDLALTFDCSNCDRNSNPFRKQTIGSMEVSGLKSLSRNRTTGGDLVSLEIREFTAIDNTFTHLPLDFSNLTSLYVINNTNLRTLTYNTNFAFYPWNEIVISGNPNLLMNSTSNKTIRTDEEIPTWFWPEEDIQRMEFQGPFDEAFFEPFIKLGTGDRKRPKVLQSFILQSSLNGFNCTGLNSLRKAGILQGEYLCQNETVGVENRAGKPEYNITLHVLLATVAVIAIVGRSI